MKRRGGGGASSIWLSAGALAVCLLMVAALVALILVNGLGFFWPRQVARLSLADGRTLIGEISRRETIPSTDGSIAQRILVKQGNRDVTGVDFVWIDESSVLKIEYPEEAVVLQRREWGNLYGVPRRLAGVEGSETAWEALRTALPAVQAAVEEIRRIERDQIGAVNRRQERIRLELRGLELKGVTAGPEVEALQAGRAAAEREFAGLKMGLETRRAGLTGRLVMELAGGKEMDVPLERIVLAYRPNTMSVGEKCRHYLGRLWNFLTDDPREANTEGGILPAIFGTVMMVVLMSLVVTPLGVLAALYLREYARQGALVSFVRIAVNNLAGVPSIVYGVFGVGFFIYGMGGTLDRLFFPEALPTPTFGTGGILWASLTLALLTLPVVIVSTEEGLSAIPSGIREASLALGATKFETTTRIILPALMPSILTGVILATARAAGEVAPLMLTGVVKLAPSLPLDGLFPFVHLERKFMHLGFHIYDVGFQSPNVDASRPTVFATAALLLGIVVVLNLAAIVLRNRLRARFRGAAV